MREIGCQSKIDVISKVYGGSYNASPTSEAVKHLSNNQNLPNILEGLGCVQGK
jgi:hypothetical protein